MRVKHFVKHCTESVDSIFVLFCVNSDPLVAPAEDRDTTVELLNSGWLMGVGDMVGHGTGVCPDAPGEDEATQRYCQKKHYD